MLTQNHYFIVFGNSNLPRQQNVVLNNINMILCNYIKC